MIEIIRSSFNECEIPDNINNNPYAPINGRVDVLANGKIISCIADRNELGSIYVQGWVGRYETGTKAWCASLWLDADNERINVMFGRDDRSGRFNKLNAIYYAPEHFLFKKS